MATRLATNYTITYSAGNLVITYASVYATQTVSVNSLILTGLTSPYFVIGDSLTGLTTLDFSKNTSPTGADVSLLITAILALIPTVPTLAATPNTWSGTNVFTGLVTINGGVSATGSSIAFNSKDFTGVGAVGCGAVTSTAGLSGTTGVFSSTVSTGALTPTTIIQTTTNKMGRSISTDTTLTANTDMGKTIIGVIPAANLLVTLMNSTGQPGFVTIAVGATSNLAFDLRVIPGGGETIFGLGLNDGFTADKYFTLLNPAVGDYIKLQSDLGGLWLVVDACGAWTRQA